MGGVESQGEVGWGQSGAKATSPCLLTPPLPFQPLRGPSSSVDGWKGGASPETVACASEGRGCDLRASLGPKSRLR